MSMVELTKYYLFLLGLATVASGVTGFAVRHSTTALAAGGSSGIVLLFAGALTASKSQPAVILALLLALSVMLATHFFPEYAAPGGIMPSGLLGVASLIGAVLAGITLVAAKKRR